MGRAVIRGAQRKEEQLWENIRGELVVGTKRRAQKGGRHAAVKGVCLEGGGGK